MTAEQHNKLLDDAVANIESARTWCGGFHTVQGFSCVMCELMGGALDCLHSMQEGVTGLKGEICDVSFEPFSPASKSVELTCWRCGRREHPGGCE